MLLEPTDLYNMLQQATTFSNLSDQNYLLLIGKLILHCLALFVVCLQGIFIRERWVMNFHNCSALAVKTSCIVAIYFISIVILWIHCSSITDSSGLAFVKF